MDHGAGRIFIRSKARGDRSGTIRANLLRFRGRDHTVRHEKVHIDLRVFSVRSDQTLQYGIRDKLPVIRRVIAHDLELQCLTVRAQAGILDRAAAVIRIAPMDIAGHQKVRVEQLLCERIGIRTGQCLVKGKFEMHPLLVIRIDRRPDLITRDINRVPFLHRTGFLIAGVRFRLRLRFGLRIGFRLRLRLRLRFGLRLRFLLARFRDLRLLRHGGRGGNRQNRILFPENPISAVHSEAIPVVRFIQPGIIYRVNSRLSITGAVFHAGSVFSVDRDLFHAVDREIFFQQIRDQDELGGHRAVAGHAVADFKVLLLRHFTDRVGNVTV